MHRAIADVVRLVALVSNYHYTSTLTVATDQHYQSHYHYHCDYHCLDHYHCRYH